MLNTTNPAVLLTVFEPLLKVAW